MKILLLGSNGQLGSDIIRLCFHQNTKHKLISSNRNDLDVSQLQTIKSYLLSLNFDVLINCISYNQTEDCETNESHAYTINAFSVKEMAEACKLKNARFVHFSTDYVFGNNALHQPLNESISPSPLSVYGSSKLMGENLALSAHDDVLVLRTASLFGIATSNSRKGNFVESIYHAAKKTGHLKVINDIFMSPTASIDLAAMTLKIINNNAPPGIYHAVNSGSASWFEFAEHILNETKINAKLDPITSNEYNSQMQRPKYSVLDNSKISQYVGEIPNWKDALHRYLKEKNYLMRFK